VASRTGLDERGWKWRRDGGDESDKLDCGVEENRGCGRAEGAGGDGEPVVQMMAEIRGVLDRLEWKGVGMVVVEEKKGGKEEEEQQQQEQQQQRGRNAEIDISVRCLQAIPHFGPPFFLQSSLGIEVCMGVLDELCFPLRA